jgi:hydroxypyruvate reductase
MHPLARSAKQLHDDALAIWRAGVAAVQSDRLVRENLRVDGDWLLIGDEELPLASIGRIVVVGAGKAGAGMGAGVEQALGEKLLAAKQLTGWINVPADCVRNLSRIQLHAARPAGMNEPTAAGVNGSEKILELVGSLRPNDLCLCLISGGGSALLPAPIAGVSLADKQQLTRQLSAAGANITELNTVRKQLSRIKGGGLARACRAGRLFAFIISDVIGDPLEIIASGPTVLDTSTPQAALDVLSRLQLSESAPPSIIAYLQRAAADKAKARQKPTCEVTNLVIGNNAVAVDAAGCEAERRGYSHAMLSATSQEGTAEEVGTHLAEMARRMRDEPGPDCLITGGEPTVRLVPSAERGRGGRNQQLALAGMLKLMDTASGNPLDGIALLSGGTDGEDGPTDAAGAIVDAALYKRMIASGLDPLAALRRNDAYNFLEPLAGLLKTGPTHTNVCDVRVVVVDRVQTPR